VKKYLVKDLMVPISKYATVSEGTSLLDSIRALEKAKDAYSKSGYSHRGVLILDKNKKVIGKLSQLDFLKALEIGDDQIGMIEDITKFGFKPMTIINYQEKSRPKDTSIEAIYSAASSRRVEEFMHSPTEGEYIHWDISLDTAIHQLISGLHLSLLVLKEKEIIGILRLSDVFFAVSTFMKDFEKKAKVADKE